jgi:hypothetical protein
MRGDGALDTLRLAYRGGRGDIVQPMSHDKRLGGSGKNGYVGTVTKRGVELGSTPSLHSYRCIPDRSLGRREY